MRKVPATTKAVGRDITWWDTVLKTQTTARAITGYGEDDDGARILFYRLPGG
jgi:hypothetical protein